MPLLVHLQNSFNGGKMAPFVRNRGDLDKYRASLRDASNMIPTQFGPIRRRPGFIYRGNTKNNAKECRLIPFDVGTDDGFALEFGDEYVRFWRNDALVEEAGSAWADATGYAAGEVVSYGSPEAFYVCILAHTSDASGGQNEPVTGAAYLTYWYPLTANAAGDAGIYELPTSYDEDDLFDIQVAQVNDVMFLVHEDYREKRLMRYGNTRWALEDIPWSWPPVRDANTSDTTITSSGVAAAATVTLTASAPLFNASMVGGYFVVSHDRADDEWQESHKIDASAGDYSDPLRIRGGYQFRTTGVWGGTLIVQESVDGVTYYDVRQFEGAKDSNYVVNLTTKNGELRYVRVRHATSTDAGTDAYAYIEAIDPVVSGVVKITAVATSTSATATVVKRLYSTDATDVWAEGAFSDYRGHARSVALHELRLVFGGTKTDRQFLWASQTDDFYNFETGTDDTDSFRYQLASNDHNAIEWIVSQKQLLIGSSGGEWVLDGGRDENVITPTNRRARRHSNYGSEYKQAITVDSATLFLRSGGERLSDFSYVFEQDGYQSVDLNLLSYDQTRGGIRQLDYQRKRDPFIWSVVAGGSLACVAYNRAQNVTGWTPITSPGNSGTDRIESLCVVPRAGDEDAIYCVIKRTINSGVVRYIEQLDPDAFDKQEDASYYEEQGGYVSAGGDDLVDLCFVDCAAIDADWSYDSGTDVTTVTGLDHLVGETVVVVVDGSRINDKTVGVGGEFTIDGTVTQVNVGMAYESMVRTLPLFNSLETGSIRGREIQIEKVVVGVHRSGAFHVHGYDDPNDGQNVAVRSTDIPEGTATPLRDGDFELGVETRSSLDPSVVISTSEPTPLTLVGLVLKYRVHGD